MRKRRLFWLSVLILYAVTWIGGWLTCARELEETAWVRYRRAREVVGRDLVSAREAGEDTSVTEHLKTSHEMALQNQPAVGSLNFYSGDYLVQV